MTFVVGTLLAKAGLDIDLGSFQKLRSEVEGTSNNLGKLSDTQKLAVGGIATGVTTAVGAIAAAGVSTAASFEDANATLTTLYGSTDLAKQKFQELSTFAASTPFEFPELLDASTKLKAYGIEAGDYLTVLGDTASAMNKTLDESVEALADAQTGEFERLKEFGIKAIEITKSNAAQLGVSAEQAGKTALTYTDKYGKQQVAVIDRNNREMITKTVTGIWNEKYEGAMEARSKSFNGMLSTLKDNLNMALADFMGFNQGVDDFGISALSVSGILKGLVGVAISATNVFSGMPEWLQAGVVAMVGMVGAVTGLIAIKLAWLATTGVLNTALKALNLTTKGLLVTWGPVVLAVGAVAAGLYILEQKTGLVSAAFRVLKDIATIAFYGTLTMFKTFYNVAVWIFDGVKQKVLEMIPESWVNTLSSIVNKAIEVLSKLGVNISTRAEESKTRWSDIGQGAQNMATNVQGASTSVQGSTGIMGQALDTLGLKAGDTATKTEDAGNRMINTFTLTGQGVTGLVGSATTSASIFNANMGSMEIAAGNMGTQTQTSGTQSITSLNGVGSAATSAGSMVVAATGNMAGGLIQTESAARQASGAFSFDLKPAVDGATGSFNAGSSAVQVYNSTLSSAISRLGDLRVAANEASTAMQNAGASMEQAQKRYHSTMLSSKSGNQLGIVSKGGKGTGEGNLKIIAAKTTNNYTIKTG